MPADLRTAPDRSGAAAAAAGAAAHECAPAPRRPPQRRPRGVVVGALLAATALAVLVQVLVRFVLTAVGINISAPWTERRSAALHADLDGLPRRRGSAARRAQMIRARGSLVRRLPARIGVPIPLTPRSALSVAFFVLLIWVGLPFVRARPHRDEPPVMNLEKSIVYWALPVGAGLMILNSLALVLETVLERRDIRFAADGPAVD